jgi:hypothetical protein
LEEGFDVPEMDIEVASGFLDHVDILARILAYVFWPENEERRRTYIAEIFSRAIAALQEINAEKIAAGTLAQLQEMTAEQLDTEGLSMEAVQVAEQMALDGDGELACLWKEVFDLTRSEMFGAIMADFYELGGGFGALPPTLQGLGPGMQEPRLEEVQTAAAILDIVRRIAEHHAEVYGPGSVNKAVFIIEETGANYGLLHGRTSILTSWRKYKNVAHLACALNDWAHRFQFDDDSHNITQIAVLLAVARDYQRFATTYFSGWQKKGPLLDPADIWAVPDDLLLPTAPAQAPLPEDMLNALDRYRAPV